MHGSLTSACGHDSGTGTSGKSLWEFIAAWSADGMTSHIETPGLKKSPSRHYTWLWVAAVGAVLGVVLATGPPWWFKFLSPGHIGGCTTYQIYAEDRGSVHTTVWSAPTTTSNEVATLSTIASIAVDGWTFGSPVPALDVSTRDSRIWFRLADGAGWVPFASVRAYPTGYDPTSEDPAVVQAATPADCEVQ